MPDAEFRAIQASDVLAGLLKKAGVADGVLPKGAAWPPGVPQLPELIQVGQLVRCTVMDLQQVGALHRSGWDSTYHVCWRCGLAQMAAGILRLVRLAAGSCSLKCA